MLCMMKKAILVLAGTVALTVSGTALASLSTEALTRLKASGLGEEIIRFMIENGYDNVDRVLKLKEAGFADETIATVIRSDLKTTGEPGRTMPQAQQANASKPAQQTQPVRRETELVAEAPVLMRTTAKVKIEQYVGLGEPVVQNSQDIPNATVSLLEGRRLKIEWGQDGSASTPGRLLWRKPFDNPFYWDLSKGDLLHRASSRDNSFTLRTGHLHGGSPATTRSQHWLVYLTPDNPDLARRIKELLPE